MIDRLFSLQTGITDIELIDYYKDRAFKGIAKYLNVDITNQEIEEKYSSATIELMKWYVNFDKMGGASQMSQGGRSLSYGEVKGLPNEVKNLLPLPKMRFK